MYLSYEDEDEEEYEFQFRRLGKGMDFSVEIHRSHFEITYVLKSRFNPDFLITGFIGIIILLIVLYFSIHQMFKPLSTIKKGVKNRRR